MAKLNSGTRIFGSANVDTTLTVGGISSDYLVFSANTITTPSKEIVFTQTGDISGTSILHLQNRNGVNGILIENNTTGSSNGVADLSLTANNYYHNIRLESRPNNLKSNNSSGSEVQIGVRNAATTTITPILVVSNTGVLVTNNTPAISTTTGALQVQGGAGVTGNLYANAIYTNGLFWAANGNPIDVYNTVYDLDDISYLTDGRTNVFGLTYNTANVTILSPWNLFVAVEGAPQAAFQYNSDVVWLSLVTGAYKGYTINYDGNIEFSDAPQSGSDILIRTAPGPTNPTVKTYPFKPADILMGY
jgi:hypothetical protein